MGLFTRVSVLQLRGIARNCSTELRATVLELRGIALSLQGAQVKFTCVGNFTVYTAQLPCYMFIELFKVIN